MQFRLARHRSSYKFPDRENEGVRDVSITNGLRGLLRMRGRITLALALFLGASAVWGHGVRAQDQSAATAGDAIIARKTVMGALSEKMDDIETAISAGKVDLDQARAAADTVSIYLMAFPHLFSPATNRWKPGGDKDPATDTFASPDVWTQFADFYKLATAASKSAFDASRAQNEAELKAAIEKLRTQCNACHTVYLKAN
jgi:cytochrome c556